AGVRIEGSGMLMDSCDVSGSAGDGVLVLRGVGVRVNHCNLAGNAAAGLENLGADTVDARLNWWGAAGGPGAAGAARVVGPVNYTQWATSPFTITATSAALPALPAARRFSARPGEGCSGPGPARSCRPSP
ncbi:MAG TPA: hypothetical protein VF832_08185, partial [Longimicrobiales bacterium]